jgi:spermidine/putrescine transport system permease protein
MGLFDKILGGYSALVFAFLYVPLIVLIAFSFSSNRNVSWPFGEATIKWYYDVLANTQIMQALYNTLFIGVMTAILTTVIGVTSTFAVMRYFSRKIALVTLAFLVFPELIPDMVKGIAQLMFFVEQHISLSLWTVIIGHVVFTIPYTALLTAARVVSLDVSLEEASMDLGAGRFQTFRYITLPLMAPAIFASIVFAFTLSINDYLVTVFIAGPQPLLPLVFWGMIHFGISPVINAISTIIFGISLATALIGFYWMAKTGKNIMFF